MKPLKEYCRTIAIYRYHIFFTTKDNFHYQLSMTEYEKYQQPYIDDDGFKVKHPPSIEEPIEDHGVIGNMHCMIYF